MATDKRRAAQAPRGDRSKVGESMNNESLIERLSRDRQTLIVAAQRDDDNVAVLQQRIAELEDKQ